MKEEETVTLFRPVGPKELALIRESGHREFPPRLPEQPIFYPVLNEEYAAQIARDWNAKDPATGYRSYVTSFRVRATYLCRYQPHTIGNRVHREYWIPAEDLPELNRNIVGTIEVVAEFHSPPHGPSERPGGRPMSDPVERIRVLWAEHLSAPFPEIAPDPDADESDPGLVDAHAAGCIQTFLDRGGKLDDRRIESLRGCAENLRQLTARLDGYSQTYFERLLEMTEGVLWAVSSRGGGSPHP
jgi:hypothetical protein